MTERRPIGLSVPYRKAEKMENSSFDDAFEEWWKDDGEGGDLPYPDISKDKQRAIFLAGYLWGSRKPVYQMSVSQYTSIVKAIEAKIREEKNT